MARDDSAVDAIVVGGGPAGCACALELLRRGRRVTVLERDEGAPARLCGEFLSPDGVALLAEWNALDAFAGAPVIRRFEIATASAALRRALPGPALGVPRQRLDPALRALVTARGGDVREGARVSSVERHGDGFRVVAGDVALRAPFVIGAVGRAARVTGLTDGPSHEPDRAAYVAMKAHFACETAGDVVTLDPLGGAYVGTSAVGPRAVNVCFLARRDAFDAAGRCPERLLERTTNTAWLARYARLERSTPWVSVAAMSFRARRPAAGPHVLVGDSAALVSPFLGEGISMALESGRLAAIALHEAGRTECAVEVAARYAARWRRRFAGRLRLGQWVQRVLLSDRPVDHAVRVLAVVPGIVDGFVRGTRSRELVQQASELLGASRHEGRTPGIGRRG